MTEDALEQCNDALETYTRNLFPHQQSTIAQAQLAGCRFEFERVRFAGAGRTTVVGAYTPNGEVVGVFDDIYEAAIKCLAVLEKDTLAGRPDAPPFADGAFALRASSSLGKERSNA